MKEIAFSKTIKAGAKGRNGLLRQSGIQVIKSGWEPVKWLHPVTGRGAASDACYLTVPNNVAGELAAAITDVDPAIMALFLAMVRHSPVTFTGPVFASVPGAHKGGPFRIYSVRNGRAEIEHITSGGIYDVHFSNIQIL